ncbi:large ribosomal subunit protein mL53 [Salarias fasciatus]|uniref:Large ribosomal subunit protein mL53 n=1 Tax=Salarias fasciatus TaxID=181472 RepID=A0A672I441_SALFA|nr:39S ribosomal protein L53, mitochondrial-like [Salarias fasciatus]
MAASRKASVVLKAVKKITVQFCPFESNVRSTREFLSLVGSEKARATNMNCEVIPMVKHDKSEPVVEVNFVDGDTLLMKGTHLSSKEMLSVFQSRCAAKDPQGKPAAKK